MLLKSQCWSITCMHIWFFFFLIFYEFFWTFFFKFFLWRGKKKKKHTNLLQPLRHVVLSFLQTSLEPFLLFQELQTAGVCFQHSLHSRGVVGDHLWWKLHTYAHPGQCSKSAGQRREWCRDGGTYPVHTEAHQCWEEYWELCWQCVSIMWSFLYCNKTNTPQGGNRSNNQPPIVDNKTR